MSAIAHAASCCTSVDTWADLQHEELDEDTTPSTTVPEDDEADTEEVPRQLQAGPPPESTTREEIPSYAPPSSRVEAEVPQAKEVIFSVEETLFIFDWDDTVLPSTWLQQNGLRLDAASQPTDAQREILAEVAAVACRTIRAARQRGAVVLVTNAERGWIELSCQKFLPVLYPMLENIKMVSARTTYEGPKCASPLEWKLRAFAVEIETHFGLKVLTDAAEQKNILSLGDSLHEREAVLTATASLPSCSTKSLKFVERPSISEICKQHDLISNCFDQIVHHNGNLDLCVRCP
jgi:hypothetical protein